MRRATKKRAAALRVYARLREEYLIEHPWCIRCGGEADQIHHRAGRVAGLLLDTSKWGSVCGPCHSHITEHPRESVARGWSLPRVALVPVDGVERAG